MPKRHTWIAVALTLVACSSQPAAPKASSPATAGQAGAAGQALAAGHGGDGGNGGDAGSVQPSTPSFDDCYVGHADCADACHLVNCCAPDQVPLADCLAKCEASQWVEAHAKQCLALRVFWIDEEGCQRIVNTYGAFDPQDDCTGPMYD